MHNRLIYFVSLTFVIVVSLIVSGCSSKSSVRVICPDHYLIIPEGYGDAYDLTKAKIDLLHHFEALSRYPTIIHSDKNQSIWVNMRLDLSALETNTFTLYVAYGVKRYPYTPLVTSNLTYFGIYPFEDANVFGYSFLAEGERTTTDEIDDNESILSDEAFEAINQDIYYLSESVTPLRSER